MPRKGESIYKRKDGRWEGRYIRDREPNGKARYGYVYGSSYRQTKDRLVRRLAGLEPSPQGITAPSVSTATFASVAERWLSAKRSGIKESTYFRYRGLLQCCVIPQIGSIPVAQITADTLSTLYAALLHQGGRKQQGLSSKTVSDIFSVVKSVLKYARMQKIPVSCTGTELTIHTVNRELRILSESEQRQLVEYLLHQPLQRNLGILLCLYTGLRLGELCALRWEDISLTEQTIYIHRTMQRLPCENSGKKRTAVVITGPKSQSSIRLIPIPPVLRPILEQARMDSGYVLTGSEHYVEPRSMEYYFKCVLRRAGIPELNFHALRHTFATRCVELGFDVKTLSKILGHSSVTITMNRYVHPTMQMKRDNMERLHRF